MSKPKIKSVAVLTSGGDSSGMNPAVRAVVRASIFHGLRIYGVHRGYLGMINDEIEELSARSVSNIISRGGTILKTARCKEFLDKKVRARALANLERRGIDSLVVIGGDGSFRGAAALSAEGGVRIAGVPGTIDNDIIGTDYTIGYDTAVNVAMEAIDKIRDTAASHERLFFVEVMGRHAGYIALEAGIAGGAEDVLVPETPTDLEDVSRRLLEGKKNGKTSFVVVVAEGDELGGAYKVSKEICRRTKMECRVSILGHLQRGGSPTALERVNASRLGAFAVEELVKGKSGFMAGILNGKVKASPLANSWQGKRPAPQELVRLQRMLSI